jgi:hypothetical protein
MMAVRRALCKMMSYYVDESIRTVRRPVSRMGPRVVAVALFGVVAMNGCGGGSGPGSGSAGTGEPSQVGAASPSLELASQQPTKGGAAATYTGVLASDAIEGGCAYVQAPEGRKYEVIYPDGWELRKSPLELVSPDGRVVARAGDEVTVRGAEADMVSVCQLGPIIQATEVVLAG